MTTTMIQPRLSFETSILQAAKEYKPSPELGNVSATPLLDRALPSELLSLALSVLHSAGVKLIEWDSMLYKRMGVPLVFKNFSYIVQDEQLSQASQCLSQIGLPHSEAHPLLIDTGGYFYTQSVLHRLTKSEEPGPVSFIALFPVSFISFLPSELFLPAEAPKNLLSLPDVRIPRPSAVYAAILRLLSKYPRGCSSRSSLLSELSMLITYHLYLPDEPGYQDNGDGDDDDGNAERDAADVAHALGIIRLWRTEWRLGEEWMGDALAAVVATGRSDWLPWKSES